MSSANQMTDLEQVCRAIHTLYSQDVSIAHTDKQAASMWLNEFQQSVHAWEIADQLLHRKADLPSCYFAAHTLRTKIQCYFQELPDSAHVSLRDSLLQHLAAINGSTDHIIVTQLCLAVTHLILQAAQWGDPIGHLLNTFGGNPNHWWPVIEVLTLLPEEVHSRKLQLGENRRHEVINQLELVATTVFAFLKQCLSTCLATSNSESFPVDACLIGIVKCFGSWVLVNPECFFVNRDAGSMDVLSFSIQSLRDGKCNQKLHSAATETLCAVSEVVPDMDVSSNNNATELQNFQLLLHTSIMSFSDAYAYAVAEEDQDKIINYCRIFTEYGENMVSYMLRNPRDPHFSIQVVNKILDCEGHHDYEVAENTFGFWYKLTEDLYHAHDESLNMLFRPFAMRLVICMYKHCHIEPDHDGPLTSSDEFYEFRRKAAELVEDVMFIIGSVPTFQQLGELYKTETSWDAREAALFLLYHVAKSCPPNADPRIVHPIVESVLNTSEWRHVCLKIAAVRFLGGMAKWLNSYPTENLEKTLNFLVSCLPEKEYSNTAAVALQHVCQDCADHIARNYIDNLLHIVSQMDKYEVPNEAVVGLMKGVSHVVGILPPEKLAVVVRQICWAQLQPLKELCESNVTCVKGTKTDPVFWVERLSALFRNPAMNPETDNPKELQIHPCSLAICEDLWPVLSKVCERYQEDPRVMERVCRCLRYAVRCVRKHSHPFLEPLVMQLVSIYSNHQHSCFLYLGSILVDEYGEEEQCRPGLLQMLRMFMPPTFHLLNEPNGFRNHPDTVDDFFRLCARYLQRCPIAMLKSDVMVSLLQCANQGTQLDHREANGSVLKFLFDFVHSGRRHKEEPDFLERQHLVKSLLSQMAAQLITLLIHGIIFTLPSYCVADVSELLYEIKELMPQETSQWLEDSLKQLPNKTAAGSQTATGEQLGHFHKQTMRCPKDLSRSIKEFCRLFR